MAERTSRSALFPFAVPALLAVSVASAAFGAITASAQVFVVGERSATAGIATDFTPTRLALPDGRLSERGRRELIRDLEAEQGFAHRALPMGPGLTLEANGPLTPGPDQYKEMIYKKGQSSAPGDRVVVTALLIKPDRLVIDLNGGPYAKHRFLSHISLNDAPIAANRGEAPTGSRVTLVFKDGIPEISAPEIKALLTPVIDFGAKTSSDAYADTLPAPVKESIAAHDILVGMSRRMVLASVGAPESKIREHADDDPDGPRFEEWIYGHVPQTVKFVRFNGDHVVQVKIAALGKPLDVHNQNEMGEYGPQPEVREIALGDGSPEHHAAPTLREPGETLPASIANSPNKVQFPPQSKPVAADKPAPTPAPPNMNEPAPTAPAPGIPANHLAELVGGR